MNLDKLDVQRKTGNENLHHGGHEFDASLLGFWQWSASDLVSNATRGILAEYLVALALDIDVKNGVRDEWAPYDLETASGVKIEVKSAAYIQTWQQNAYSAISFGTAETTAWSTETKQRSGSAQRQADVYVFALLAHRDKATIDPLDVNQWQFYALPTHVLNSKRRSQKTISLSSLERLAGKRLTFREVKQAVDRAGIQQRHDDQESALPPREPAGPEQAQRDEP